jgi:hypothetical protein
MSSNDAFPKNFMDEIELQGKKIKKSYYSNELNINSNLTFKKFA